MRPERKQVVKSAALGSKESGLFPAGSSLSLDGCEKGGETRFPLWKPVHSLLDVD